MKVPLNIFTGFYESESQPFNAQRCINMIPVIPQAKSLNERALFCSDGLDEKFELSGVNRGSITANGLDYFVNGEVLWSVDSSYTKTNLGTVLGTSRVSMATNTTIDSTTKIVIVVPGSNTYVYDTSLGTVALITDADFLTADTVSFKDSYYVFTASNGLQAFNSDENDPTSYDALNRFTAEVSPDAVTGSIVNHNELYVMGEFTGELFQINSSIIDGSPFQRVPGGTVEKGLHAKFSIIEFDNSFVFAGGGVNENTAIWKMTGSASAMKISTSAIDSKIQKFNRAEIAESFAMVWSRRGQTFVSFTFESSRIPSRTFIYNATTSALSGESTWHEAQSGTSDDRWRVSSITQSSNGDLLCGDNSTAKIGLLDEEVFTEYGEPILRQVTSQPYRVLDNAQFLDNLELVLEPGVALTSGHGSDPIVRMKYSDNGWRTESAEFSRKFGKLADWDKRTKWRRQGRAPTNRSVSFVMTDPVRFNILACTLSDEVGE